MIVLAFVGGRRYSGCWAAALGLATVALARLEPGHYRWFVWFGHELAFGVSPSAKVFVAVALLLTAACGLFARAQGLRDERGFICPKPAGLGPSGLEEPVESRNLLGSLLLVAAASAGVALAADWLSLFLAWEILTLAVYLLILQKDRGLARRYLLVQLTGAAVLLVGIAQCSLRGNLLISPVGEDLLPFFGFGLGTKTAILGLHFWLPPVHSQVAVPVSALLSGLVVKLGLFTWGRLAELPYQPFLLLGTAMVVFGGLYAALQRDGKRLLAYSTISHVGLVTAGLGAGGEVAAAVALGHAIQHMVVKGLAFLSFGRLSSLEGTRDLYKLARAQAWRRCPPSAAFLALAIASLAGFPLSGLGRTKHLIIELVKEEPGYAVLLYVGSLLGVVYALRMLIALAGGPLPGRRGEVAAAASFGEGDQKHGVYGVVDSGQVFPLALLAGIVIYFSLPQGQELLLVEGAAAVHSAAYLGELALFGAMALVAVGMLGAFGRFAPAGFVPPDADQLFEWTLERGQRIVAMLQSAHNGNLRRYLLWSLIALIAWLAAGRFPFAG